jgi:N4-(beta-N-acetylglucosaminyl)-L-asparaginase
MKNWTRRRFFLTTLAGSLATGAQRLLGAVLPARTPATVTDLSAKAAGSSVPQAAAAKGTRPVIISSFNGLHALQKGIDILKSGGDTLDATIAAVTVVEDDPNDNSVGYGGLPNEEGEPELDSCLMHGPTRRAGAVGGLRRVKNPARLAKVIMERTNHVFLVGEGAYKFAVDEGFESQSLLTEKSRMAWLAWKAHTSENWAPGLDSPEWKERLDTLLDTPEKKEWASWINEVIANPPTGTMPCMAANEKGEISGVVTTSGLAWKIPGRVGDSGVLGAGMFCDGDVGAAGSTGRGEENIKISGGHTIVELMRHGMSPQDACMEAMHRVIRNYTRGYGNEKERLAKIGLQYYALNKDGAHGAATLWAAATPEHNDHYAVHDGTEAKLVVCQAALQRS